MAKAQGTEYRTPQARNQIRAAGRARIRALQILGRRYPEEFREIYNECAIAEGVTPRGSHAPKRQPLAS